MTNKRVPLFTRLPEIYRIKDAQQSPPDQLRDYLALVEDAFGAIHENVEALYHDLFIEFCDDWTIPYVGDLLGTSHLKGETWTLRGDLCLAVSAHRTTGAHRRRHRADLPSVLLRPPAAPPLLLRLPLGTTPNTHEEKKKAQETFVLTKTSVLPISGRTPVKFI